MKKVLLMSVFVFALSQGGFAATSFADLLKQEKSSTSFMPKIEVQTVSTELLDEKREEWFGNNLSEYVGSPTTWTYAEDKTHAWRLENKSCYTGTVEQFENKLSEKIYQNAPGDKCQKTREKIYEVVDYIYKPCREEYSAAQCYANNEEIFKYTCEEATKTVDYEDGEKIVRTYKETDTCYNE